MVQDVRTIKLTFIYDFWCQWCYIGFLEIFQAMDKCKDAKLPIRFDIEYRPFQLDSTFPADLSVPRSDYLKTKYGEQKAEMIEKMVGERARALGIEALCVLQCMRDRRRLTWCASRKCGPIRSTMRAHRLMLRAYALGGAASQTTMLRRLFKAYSENEQDIGDINTLAELAQDVQLMTFDEVIVGHI